MKPMEDGRKSAGQPKTAMENGRTSAGQRPPSVKICGITRPETMKAIRHLPIDQLGLVFAPSKRQVDARRASELTSALRENAAGPLPQTVGVFVQPSWDELAEAVESAGLEIVQLHSDEPASFCRRVKEQLGVQVFKSVPVQRLKHPADVREQLDPYQGVIDAVLLDTHDPTVGGGTGRTFDWAAIPVFRDWTRESGIRLIVAGGLHPDNVQELLRQYEPDGVDVSSGVESDGVKDIVKIEQFVERVKQLG